MLIPLPSAPAASCPALLFSSSFLFYRRPPGPHSVCSSLTPPPSFLFLLDMIFQNRVFAVLTQSDSFISDAVHRFWDRSQRCMTPGQTLDKKQGRTTLWMQRGKRKRNNTTHMMDVVLERGDNLKLSVVMNLKTCFLSWKKPLKIYQ